MRKTTFGVQRDRIKDREAAQCRRFDRMLADRIMSWSSEGQISPFLLVGGPGDVEAIAVGKLTD